VPREDETCREYYDSNFAIPNNDIGNTIVLKNSNFELYLNKNYLNKNFMRIESDDSSVFGITGLTYDFCEASMAWNLDLHALKRLVYNSIIYSNLSLSEQKKMIIKIDRDWKEWVTNSLSLLKK